MVDKTIDRNMIALIGNFEAQALGFLDMTWMFSRQSQTQYNYVNIVSLIDSFYMHQLGEGDAVWSERMHMHEVRFVVLVRMWYSLRPCTSVRTLCMCCSVTLDA